MVAIVAALIVVLAVTQVEWKWFTWGTVALMVCSIALALPRLRKWLGGRAILQVFFETRLRAWLTLAGLTALFVVHTAYVEQRRYRAEKLEVRAIRIARPYNDIIRIGTGDSVDVRLQRWSEDPREKWVVSLRYSGEHLTFVGVAGVDAIEQHDASRHSKIGRVTAVLRLPHREWQHVWGMPLYLGRPCGGPTADTVIVRAVNSPGVFQTVRLERIVGRPHLVVNGMRAPLDLRETKDPATRVHRRRLRRRLAGGVPLQSLAWDGTADTTLTRDLAVTLVAAPVRGFEGIDLPCISGYEFRLASRSSAWRVEGSEGGNGPSLLRLADTILVRTAGRRWKFTLGVRAESRYEAGDFVVGFGEGPRSLVGWFPPPSLCQPADRCVLLSTSPLAPSVSYFDVSDFGIDPTRDELLGRIQRRGDSVAIVTGGGVFRGKAEADIAVSLRSSDVLRKPRFVLRVTPLANSNIPAIVLTLMALGALVVAAVGMVRGSRTLQAIADLEQRGASYLGLDVALALMSFVTVLAGLRLALGLRVTFAPPYAVRALDTAVGLWIALLVLVTALLRWDRWGPLTVRAICAFEGRKRSVPASKNGEGRFQRALEWLRGVPGTSKGARGRLVLIVLGGGVLLIQWRGATLYALFVSLLVMTCWAVVAYLGYRPGEKAPDTVGEVLSSSFRSYPMTAMVVIGIGVSVWVRAQGPALTPPMLFVLGVFGALGWLLQRLHLVSTRLAWAPMLPMAAGWLFLVNLALAFKGGPMLVFLGVFLLFLVTVHSGAAEKSLWKSMFVVPLAAAALVHIDMGLVLVLAVPLVVASAVSSSSFRTRRMQAVVPLTMLLLVFAFAWPALFPDVSNLRTSLASSETTLDPSEEFDRLGGPLRYVLREPVQRAVVRWMAARHPGVLERFVWQAAPSPAREDMLPALEQAWGAGAYSASGMQGRGLAESSIAIGRGVAVPVSVAENAFAVFVLAEHGAIGGFVVIAAYMGLTLTTLFFLVSVLRARPGSWRPNSTAIAVVVGGVLMTVLPAVYVAASNLGLVPLTGQNMPFLGLNAWSDVTLTGALMSAIVAVLLDDRLLTDGER